MRKIRTQKEIEAKKAQQTEKRGCKRLMRHLYKHDVNSITQYLDEKYKPLPTAEEAAEKLGISVEQLKEIVK